MRSYTSKFYQNNRGWPKIIWKRQIYTARYLVSIEYKKPKKNAFVVLSETVNILNLTYLYDDE